MLGAVLIISIVLVVVSVATAIYYSRKAKKYMQAENTVRSFLEFNREVTKQLLALEDQGRDCYQSLDGDAMRLIYEAQKALKHGQELEKLGVDALAVGTSEILNEVEEYFNLDVRLGGVEKIGHQRIEELSPRAYKLYAVSLIQKINGKVQKGLENRKKLQMVSLVAA